MECQNLTVGPRHWSSYNRPGYQPLFCLVSVVILCDRSLPHPSIQARPYGDSSDNANESNCRPVYLPLLALLIQRLENVTVKAIER